MKNNYDVIVIGAGVIGAACAFELSKKGLSVALLEKRGVASAASGASAAMLEFQLYAHRGEPFYSLSKISNDLFSSLDQELKSAVGLDFDYERCGIVQLAYNEADVLFLKNETARQKNLGLQIEWMSADVMQAYLPKLKPGHWGGVLFKEDGQVSGEKLTQALVKAAQKNGTVLISDFGSFSFQHESGRITGVQTNKDVYQAASYVLAAGAWTGEILKSIGVHVPIVPVRGQLLIYETPNRFLPHPVYTRSNGYITPKKDGTTLVGTTIEYVGFDESITAQAKDQILKIAEHLAPSLIDQPLLKITSALRPGSPDELPFIGPLDVFKNLYVSSGHFRNGILLTPVTAQLITSLITNEKPLIDLTPFLPHRPLQAEALH